MKGAKTFNPDKIILLNTTGGASHTMVLYNLDVVGVRDVDVTLTQLCSTH